MGTSSNAHKTLNNHPMNAIKVSKPIFSGARNSFQVVAVWEICTLLAVNHDFLENL